MLTLAMGGAFVLALVFALRLALAVWHWNAPPTDPDLAGWMTPRFVAHSWKVPPEIIMQTLALERGEADRRITLGDLAAARGIPLTQLLDELRMAIAQHRAGRVP